MPPKRKRVASDVTSPPEPKKPCPVVKDPIIYEFDNGDTLDITEYHLVNSYCFDTKEAKESAINLEYAWNCGLDNSMKEFMEPYEEEYQNEPFKYGAWTHLISSLIKGTLKPLKTEEPPEPVIKEPIPQPRVAKISHERMELARNLWDFFKYAFKDVMEQFRDAIVDDRPDISPEYSSEDFLKVITELLDTK